MPATVRLRALLHLRTGLSIALVVALLAGAYVLVYLAGGTRTAAPHLFYVPILVAALLLGPTATMVTAAAAAVLCGPLMPLDAVRGVPQEATNWSVRGLFFLVIGGLAVTMVGVIRKDHEADLTDLLRRELRPRAEPRAHPDIDVHGILESEGFRIVFQPIYRLGDGQLLAVEALTRIGAHPDRSPQVWFEQAAREGIGVEFELATLRAALTDAATLDPGIVLSVNASPDLLDDPRLLELLDEHPGRPLMVEVTEHDMVDDYRILTQALRTLRRRGVLLAVDDAGAGFASFRHVVRLSPDYIKLDLSLVQDVRGDPIRRALANALMQFATDTGCRLVAEGIEEPNDLVAWRELGAYAAQGFLLGRPAPLPPPAAAPWVPAGGGG